MFASSYYRWVVLAALPLTSLQAAPQAYNRPNNGMEDTQTILRQVRNNMADLKHEINNHENEIRGFDGRLQNQENVVENLRQQVTESIQSQQDQSRAQIANIEGKLESLDGVVKGLISDLRQMKTQSNDSVAILGQYKQKLSDIEKIIESQNQHMKSLEVALNSIMELLQVKEAPEKTTTKSASGSKTYKVQPGDSLDKIARANKVTIQALRDCNNLTQDRINVGQTIKIP
ncbi:MAG: LysM peptidoglycan-binding domain-containing protein [Parachlamydiaceae bacterium]|nr:LysM peptidoglycan-binding domain-containing protein [Parachlamydiaceae bacterium]